MYEYQARVVRVVDGDTLKLEVDLGCSVQVRLTVRLLGLNAPELATAEGQAALGFVRDWLSRVTRPAGLEVAPVVTVRTVKDRTEKYGRYLATVLAAHGPQERCLNDDLLAAGQAQPYDGHGR